MNRHLGTNQFADDQYYLEKMNDILDGFPTTGCPPQFPSKLMDHVYLGNQDNADNVDLLLALGITHVLNCAGTRTFDLTRSPYPEKAGISGYLMIPAEDYEEFDIMVFFVEAIGFLDKVKAAGGKALVHCTYGVNRSGAVAAAYLMVSEKRRLMNVINDLKAKRSLVLSNTGFRKQLIRFARCISLLDMVNPSLVIAGQYKVSPSMSSSSGGRQLDNQRTAYTMIDRETAKEASKKSASEINDNIINNYLLKSKTPLDNMDNDAAGNQSAQNKIKHIFSKCRHATEESDYNDEDSNDSDGDNDDLKKKSFFSINQLLFPMQTCQGTGESAMERRSRMFIPSPYTNGTATSSSKPDYSYGKNALRNKIQVKMPDISQESKRVLSGEKSYDCRKGSYLNTTSNARKEPAASYDHKLYIGKEETFTNRTSLHRTESGSSPKSSYSKTGRPQYQWK